ncbi:4-hydroxy-tetrahydrodipicolinate reductase [Trichinella spiralis]|uniref:4-hydroxy-tetrahydrodipicolinate reductase n=1 Tax=Trichinella spiralis TaxID=6334 RepID=A0ABR3K6J3_TRISP
MNSASMPGPGSLHSSGYLSKQGIILNKKAEDEILNKKEEKNSQSTHTNCYDQEIDKENCNHWGLGRRYAFFPARYR